MESSFKKTHQKTVNSDGSFDLKFTSSMLRGNPIGFFIGWFMASFWVTWQVIELIPIQSIGRRSGDGTVVLICLAIEIFVYFAPIIFLLKILKKDEVITVIPNQGIKFRGKNLPFSDIQTLGTKSQGTQKTNSFVHAVSHGTEIRVTGNMVIDLVEALADEIRNNSGVIWK